GCCSASRPVRTSPPWEPPTRWRASWRRPDNKCGIRSAECGIAVKGRSRPEPSRHIPHSAFRFPHSGRGGNEDRSHRQGGGGDGGEPRHRARHRAGARRGGCQGRDPGARRPQGPGGGARVGQRPGARAWLRRGGRIINITSVVGIYGNKGQSNYTASKAGLIGFTKSVSKELASRNVLVNAVAPGFIDTELTRAITGDAREALIGAIPLGRLG